MKNAVLITSTLCAIAMMLFINMGMDTLNEAQEESMSEVNEWMEEIDEKMANQLAMEEPSPKTARGTFSGRLRELSNKQQSISTDILQELAAGPQGKLGTGTTRAAKTVTDPDAIALRNTLMQRQLEIIDEFTQLEFDLSEQLAGVADYRHIQTLDSMRASNAIGRLKIIRTMLLRNQQRKAAETADTWTEKMAKWADDLNDI